MATEALSPSRPSWLVRRWAFRAASGFVQSTLVQKLLEELFHQPSPSIS